jgi:Na+/proline symporter
LITASLSTIDYTVIIGYFVVVLYIGLRMARRTHSGEDLFLAGRRLGWVPIGFSLFASNISSTTLVGLSGAAYVWGIAVSNYEWMAAYILVFFALFIIPCFLNAGITTVPEFLERRFDRRSRVYFSGLTLFSNIVVDTAGTLFAGAMVMTVFFPGVDLVTACLVLACVAGLYTAAGGLAAVVYLVPPVAVVFALGLFWRGINATGAFAALLGGHGISALLFAMSAVGVLELHFTIVAGLLAAFSLVIATVASRLGDQPSEQQLAHYTVRAGDVPPAENLSWWQDYRLYSILVVTLATALVAAHW